MKNVDVKMPTDARIAANMQKAHTSNRRANGMSQADYSHYKIGPGEKGSSMVQKKSSHKYSNSYAQ